MKRLPFGEEKLPITDMNGKFLKHQEQGGDPVNITDALLVERIKLRTAEGRVGTVHMFNDKNDSDFIVSITPQEQLEHIEKGDKLGMDFLLAERKLLEEELKVMGGSNG